MARYRHYRNNQEPSGTFFITTTVLDFVHAFRRDEVRNEMAVCMARECDRSRVALYAFVVMPHHVHRIARMPEDKNVSEFMRVFKRQSSPEIIKLLTREELRELDQQRGLNRNTFWKYSFRSKLIEDEWMYWQRANYIRMNPVRAGYVESPEDYRWSSAKLIIDGHWTPSHGLRLDAIVEGLGARREFD